MTLDDFLDFMRKVYGEGAPGAEKKVQRTGKTLTQTTTTVIDDSEKLFLREGCISFAAHPFPEQITFTVIFEL